MRPVVYSVLALGLLTLCSCSVFERRGQTIILPQPTPQAAERAAPAVMQNRPARPERRDRQAKAATPMPEQAGPATIAPQRLVGLDRKAVTELLGKPKGVTHNGTSLIWAYRATNCSLRVIFYPNIETKKFHALQYVFEDAKGKALSDEKTCMRMLQLSKHDAR